MPRGDRTGPMGAGPRTGRGFGYCGSYDTPGFAYPGFGPGMGRRRGLGGGFRWRNRFFAETPAGWGVPRNAAPAEENDLQSFKAEADWLKRQLDAVNKRIEELEM
jgi:hypothetical protein